MKGLEMPGTDEQLKWEEQLNRAPRWVQGMVVFTRLSITQLFIFFTISLCVFLFLKDMGYITDRKDEKLDAITKYLESNSRAIQQQLQVTEKHAENTEDLASSVKQTTRYLCWNSRIPESEKAVACTR